MLLFLFPLRYGIKPTVSKVSIFHESNHVYIFGLNTHIYGKYIYTHNLVFSANASWILKKNVGKVSCISVCAWNIL